jgi:hypothetical protein
MPSKSGKRKVKRRVIKTTKNSEEDMYYYAETCLRNECHGIDGWRIKHLYLSNGDSEYKPEFQARRYNRKGHQTEYAILKVLRTLKIRKSDVTSLNAYANNISDDTHTVTLKIFATPCGVDKSRIDKTITVKTLTSFRIEDGRIYFYMSY